MSRRPAVRWLAGLLLLGVGACGGALRLAPTGPAPASAKAQFVDEPPPLTHIEEPSPAPADERCVWVDGGHTWDGRRWRWHAGGWIHPEPGCYRSLPELEWVSVEGVPKLRHRPAAWVHPQRTTPCREYACGDPRADALR